MGSYMITYLSDLISFPTRITFFLLKSEFET
jgi:hypothetical protein